MGKKKLTKKEFKELCSFHEYGGGPNKRNAIYYGYKQDYGWKFMVKGIVSEVKKNELLDILYDWVMDDIEPPYWVQSNYAKNDNRRFKIAVVG